MKTVSLTALLLSCCSLFLSSCKKYDIETPPPGPETEMGNGRIRSFSTVANGKPLTIGIELTPASLQGLSTSGHSTYLLTLSDEIKRLTAFDHIVVDWNPKGHAPDSVYDIPHFDFHFYTINNAERLAIGSWEKDSIALKKNPPLSFLPPHYVPAAADPDMGKHWVDTTGLEFDRVTFTKTFIYGTYNGRVNFVEPMITKAFIDKGDGFDDPIPQPTIYSPVEAWYPQIYSGKKNAAGNYTVTLSDFAWRP
ncbi:hypothetical protein EXU57_07555 [Segetibacter sp. 3557_3]|uniref:DUF5602 domain-containing protein n=1 Tax=Segetibacter sp. 3557_3 TaxID=2547429 RepID=UPI001058FC92|nr:DUF5602 domain-containing protein [Segetibacter sp. 3557_3]TDH27433.1 hypothetical protein EXU57_07555 [Segetibacter sp. 3557_3]